MIRPHSTSLARVAFVGCIVLVAGCTDGSPTSAEHVDPAEETQDVRVRVNTELALLQAAGPGRLHRSTKIGTQPVMVSARVASLHSGAADEARTIVKHFRQPGGKTLSLAWYFKRGAELPTLIYTFENGRIQAVVGLAYTRHGNGYLRRKVRVTTFDSAGTPQSQINVASDPTHASVASILPRDMLSAIPVIAADMVSFFLPPQLHAEEKPCSSEYLSYLAASAKLAAAIAAVQAASAACVGTGISCPAAGAAVIVFLDLLDQWNRALDKLIACTDAAKQSSQEGSSMGSSGGDDDSRGDYDSFGGDDDVTKTVQEFIDDSIAAGTYACSSDGDVCTYYAE